MMSDQSTSRVIRAWMWRGIEPLRNRRGECGATLLEFALSCVLLFSILFGIVDFGRALYAYDAISDAARVGTRYAIVHGSSSASPATASSISSYVTGLCCAGLSTSAIKVNATWNPNNSPGSTVNVQVQYTFNFILPFLPAASVPMSASSQMVISQ